MIKLNNNECTCIQIEKDLPKVLVRPAMKEDLALISKWEARCFHDSSLNAEGLLEWWITYPEGIKVLSVDNKAVGAIGIWPVREDTFSELKNGAIDETDIPSGGIIAQKECLRVRHSYWYIGSIILSPAYQRKGLSILLINNAIKDWLLKGNLAESVDLCAIAYSREGVLLLEKFRFNSCGRSKSGHIIYYRRTSPSQLRKGM
jgi:ribosomal protein S18 acetylase RimI-like enzyme